MALNQVGVLGIYYLFGQDPEFLRSPIRQSGEGGWMVDFIFNVRPITTIRNPQCKSSNFKASSPN